MRANSELYIAIQEEEMMDAFQNIVDDYDNGNISAAEAWLVFKSDIETLTRQLENRKAWGEENKNAIADEFEKYGKDGLHGYTAKIQTRTTLSFKNIPEWNDAEKLKKDVESKARLAHQLRQKGMEPVDANTGEILPEPEVSVTSFLKTDKVK